MSMCCICQFTVRNPRNIHKETIGQPPILISTVVLQCTKGTSYNLTEEESTICKKCCEKLTRYHKSIQVARKLRREILDLIQSPFNLKDSKITALPLTPAASSNQNNDEENLEERIEIAPAVSVDHMLHSSTVQVEIEQEEIKPNQLETSENIKSEDNTECETEEFQVVDLDIENEIIIQEVAESNAGGGGGGDKDESNDLETFEEYSDIEDHLGDTIEYVISDPDADADGDGDGDGDDNDSSNDYTINIKCPNCPEEFNSRRAYNSHSKREHFPGYVCDQCGKTLQSYSGFIGHLQNHDPDKQFECTECGERFNRKFRLKHHMAWHSGETPYQCDVCSKRFVHKVALYKHKMIHDNETKRLECKVCGFKTRTKAHLERHTRSHTGAKPFTCPVCNKRFSQMYNMKAHLREHENPGCNRQRRLHCPQCSHTFINEHNYLAHCQRGGCTEVAAD